MKITKTQLREIIREELQTLINEKEFIPTVYITKYDKEVSTTEFKTEKEAMAHLRKVVKANKMTRQRGFWGNPNTGMEARGNF